MFGLPVSAFYPNSFMFYPSTEINANQFLSTTPDSKRKILEKCPSHSKRFRRNSTDRPARKSSFDIESLLDLKTKTHSIVNQSLNDDTEDGSSDDGQTSFRSPTLSSFNLFNPLKTLDMSVQSTNTKSDLTPSSSSESEHSPYRLPASTKHMVNPRHGIHQKTKPKRIRTIFTPEQLERLESEFDKQQYMVGNERFYLATTLDLTEAQVKVWFQNRRIKWRRQALDDHQQRLSNLVGNMPGATSGSATGNFTEDEHPSDSNE